MCEEMQDIAMRKAKKQTKLLCQDENVAGMIECGPGFCLHPTLFSCLRISNNNDFIGKDNKNSMCISAQ